MLETTIVPEFYNLTRQVRSGNDCRSQLLHHLTKLNSSLSSSSSEPMLNTDTHGRFCEVGELLLIPCIATCGHVKGISSSSNVVLCSSLGPKFSCFSSIDRLQIFSRKCLHDFSARTNSVSQSSLHEDQFVPHMWCRKGFAARCLASVDKEAISCLLFRLRLR